MKRGSAGNRWLDFSLGIPALYLLAMGRRPRAAPQPPQRIGLLFNPALGDTLLASAAVADIRALYPDARLILFATDGNAAAARLLPGIDEIAMLSLMRPVKAIRILRRSKLDWMLDFTAWQRITAIFTTLSGARHTVGFAREGQYRERGYDATVAHRGDCHEIENLRRLTGSLGATCHAPPRLRLPEIAVPAEVAESGNPIVFHPWASGARSWLREWPEDRWIDLALGLMEGNPADWPPPGSPQGQQPAQPLRFLITGSAEDESRCRSLLSRLAAAGVPARVLIGRQGIAEVARVLERATLLVSVNTGIMHLGAIVGAPTLSINGPTSGLRWGPVGPRVANVGPADNSGGYLDLGFEYAGRPTDTMQKVRVADVLTAARVLLERS